jgi:hypothetical protein
VAVLSRSATGFLRRSGGALSRAALLLALAVAVTGCSSRPDEIPAPAPGWLAGFGNECPDLRGSYSLRGSDGKRRSLPAGVLRGAVPSPSHHSILAIESVDGERLKLRSAATDDDLRAGMTRWRKSNGYGYALWSRSLVARRVPDGYRLERDPQVARLEPPSQLPLSRAFAIDGDAYRCENGWVIFAGEPEPDADHIDTAAVYMTRAADGGLVARFRFRRERSLSFWCGDGCKPGIPPPDERVERWWHAPPVAPVEERTIDWEAMVADEAKRPDAADKYVAGHAMRYRDAAPSPETMSTPPALAKVEGSPVPPVAAAPAPALPHDPDIEAAWRERLGALMPAGSDITELRCEARACWLTGRARTMSDVSTLLRALDGSGHVPVELVLIEFVDNARYRFELRLPARP